ncbi:hypothetical protein BGZ60DRAFT_437530 [Tricladium varicosporioides]|nr:hypothetical protein BGZ60DRAFT_437530 [Hymenoscyphus varicosporioides]
MAETTLLTTTDDWDKWIVIIRALAEALDIWQFLNPDEQLPLLEPQRPTLLKAYSELDKNEIWELTIAREIYERKIKAFDRQNRDVKAFQAEILRRLAPINYTIFTSAKNTLEVLCLLKNRFCPTTSWREQEIINRYTKLRDRQPQKGTNTQTWLEEWERIYIDGMAADIPDICGTCPFQDFLALAFILNSTFSEN